MNQVEVTIHYLEMHAPNLQVVPAPRDNLVVAHVARPGVEYYRALYNAVGEEYRWLSRRKLSDEALAAIIHDPRDEMHVLHVAGEPAGFAELDRRQPGEVELVQFGLVPRFVGQGLGKWFLQWTTETAWSYRPKRFWLHTCTLDHPRALRNYLAAGFTEYQRETLLREW